MKSIQTKTPTGWQTRAIFAPSEQTDGWLTDLREYFEGDGHECRITDETQAVESLARVLAYVAPEEARHHEEAPSSGHIYQDVTTATDFVSSLANVKDEPSRA